MSDIAKSSSTPQRQPAIRPGRIFVLTGPSGVGKGTVCKRLLAEDPNLALSISATSRPRRVQEQDGVDYFFKTREAFAGMIEQNALLEWAEYNGNYYGTPKDYALSLLSQGRNVLLEIETQGALMVKEQFPQACLIFIAPPSMEELEKRLRGRATDSEENITSRLAISRHEMTLQTRFDHVVINDNLDVCYQAIHTILQG